MKRAALIAGVSIAALLSAGQAEVFASPNGADLFWSGRPRSVAPAESKRHSRIAPDEQKPAEKSTRKPAKQDQRERSADKTPAMPPGPLHVIVSINKQHATLFAGGVPVAGTKISSGTPGHPTPMGVFTVIQKSRHHVSNLYDAPMPYMQRITWSGSALHEGPLPGRPASHGCVRLTTDFAQLLWKATKIGARIIITRDEVAPVAIESDRLFAPRPKTVQSEPTASIKTADASNAVVRAAAVPEIAKPLVSSPAPGTVVEEPPAKMSFHHDGDTGGSNDPTISFSRRYTVPGPAPTTVTAAVAAAAAPASIIAERPPVARAATHNRKPVSVFVSLKEHKLYVRQGWEKLFDAPITIENPERPIGTHIFTAMGPAADGTGLRWTVVSIPSSFKAIAEEPAGKQSKTRAAKPAETSPIPGASAALERLVIPPDVTERINTLVTPGASLIVSDNKLSSETGDTTDFIVLTP